MSRRGRWTSLGLATGFGLALCLGLALRTGTWTALLRAFASGACVGVAGFLAATLNPPIDPADEIHRESLQ